jgi:predicted transglutaminase-like cysteine proteinase
LPVGFAVQRWGVIFRWLAGAAIALALCVPLQPSLAAPPSLLIASLAPNQTPVEASISRLPKWQRIRDWLSANSAPTDPALAEWASWAAALRARPEAERLTAINSRVNQTIRYATDMEVWGVADYWETPAEIISKRATDCEGSAILKYWLARLAGIPDNELSMFVGIIGSTHQMHAVLVAGFAGRGYVLDVRTPYVVDAATFGDFKLLVTVDLQVVEVYVRGLGSQPSPAAIAKN